MFVHRTEGATWKLTGKREIESARESETYNKHREKLTRKSVGHKTSLSERGKIRREICRRNRGAKTKEGPTEDALGYPISRARIANDLLL